MEHPYCTSPVLIFNRQVEHLIDISQMISLGKDKIFLTSDVVESWHLDFPYTMFQRYLNHVRLVFKKVYEVGKVPSFLDDYYILSDDGVCFPVFFLVPCGHCDMCHWSKSNDISKRVQYECQQHDFPPYFLLLTYNDKYLPADKLICIEDLQLFFKRLRRTLQKQGYSSFRYVSVGEYGERYHRPHFHVILFGLKPSEFGVGMLPPKLKQIINFCWRKTPIGSNESFDDYCNRPGPIFDNFVTSDDYSIGFSNIQVCRSTRSCGRYVSKYIQKQHLKLYKSINLGVEFVKSHFDSDTETFSYLDRFSNKIVNSSLSPYFVNKLFPTLSHSLKPSDKRLFSMLSSMAKSLSENPLLSDEEQKFFKTFYLNHKTLYSNLLQDYISSNPNIVYGSDLDIYVRFFELLQDVDFNIDFEKYNSNFNKRLNFYRHRPSFQDVFVKFSNRSVSTCTDGQ